MDVLRIALMREAWQCLAGDESPGCIVPEPDLAGGLSSTRRASPAALQGDWKVFDVSAVPLPDEVAAAGERGINRVPCTVSARVCAWLELLRLRHCSPCSCPHSSACSTSSRALDNPTFHSPPELHCPAGSSLGAV